MNLVQVRRQYGLTKEDALVQSHLIKAQSIVGYTLCINGCVNVINLAQTGQIQPQEIVPNFVQIIAELTSTCYLKPLQALPSKPRENTLKEPYKTGVTVPVIQTIFSVLYPQAPNIVDRQGIDLIQSLIQDAFSFQQPTKPQFLRIALPSGRVLKRTANRGIVIDGDRDVHHRHINVDGVPIDPTLSDDELLNSLRIYNINVGFFYGPEED